jgi:serine O-acetyltransferase
MKKLLLLFRSIRLIPHWILLNSSNNKTVIDYEIKKWMDILKMDDRLLFGFLKLMLFYPEFRNLFYYRVGHKGSKFIYFLCPKMNTLFINCPQIAPGLFIQHGFATIIEARSIGKDCWINQQVTIGFSNGTDCPTILDNVVITAGVKIIGNVTVGSNCKLGANSVIVKNVPDNCTVVGVPAYIVKRDGLKVKEYL